MSERTDRRCFLARGIAAAAGIGAAYGSIEERTLLAALQDGTADQAAKPKTDIPPGSMPCGKIGNVTVSRLLIGGNLFGGWAHSRDLMYVSRLFTAYNDEAKQYETLDLVQECGINTIQIDPRAWDAVLKYNQSRENKIQTMVCYSLDPDKGKMRDEIKRLVDKGATLLYPHGGMTDVHMMNGGSIDLVGEAVDMVRAEGVPSGVGSHSLNTPVACIKNNIKPDFFMKTFHIDRYWSATPKEHRVEYDWMQSNPTDHNRNNDSMWCNNPEETAAFMETVDVPWFAFKVMAAGAIHPQMAFSAAYRNGADFIVAGMFDFQVEQDAKIAIECINKLTERKRPWHG